VSSMVRAQALCPPCPRWCLQVEVSAALSSTQTFTTTGGPGLNDDGVEALLEATHRDLAARTPGTLPPLPPSFQLPSPAVPTTVYVHPPQPPLESVLEAEAAAAPSQAYELIVTVWGRPQRLVLFAGEVCAFPFIFQR
jgi:hypothetical protein